MDVLSFGLGMMLGAVFIYCASELPDYLARRKAKKRIEAAGKQFEFKEEIRTMVIGITDRKNDLLRRELMAYIDTKLAEKDKQEETREEDKHDEG